MKKIFGLFFASLLALLLFSSNLVFAQERPSLGGVAVNIEITDSEAGNGDILSVSADNFARSTVAYDNKMYGVIVEAPVISVELKGDNTKSVITSGQALVKVTNAGGNIAAGDFITSSTTAGVGQKATESGYVVGKALQAYESAEVGSVPLEVAVGFAQIGTSAAQNGSIGSIIADPGRLRLLLAVLLAIFVLVGGIIAFARLVNTGVTAIGRNPLARVTIMRGMLVSGSVVVVIMVVGIGAAVAIMMIGGQ